MSTTENEVNATQDDPAFAKMKEIGLHFAEKGRAMVKFGKALQNPNSQWSTIHKHAYDAGLALSVSIHPQRLVSTLPTAQEDVDDLWQRCMEALPSEFAPTATFLASLTDSERDELALFVSEYKEGVVGIADRPDFLRPRATLETPATEVDTDDK